MIATNAGTTLSVAVGSPDSRAISDYTAFDYIEVGEVGDISGFSYSANVDDYVPLGAGVAEAGTGTVDYGSVSITMAEALSDAGQQMLRAGFDGATKHKDHVFFLSHPTHGEIYFTALIGSLSVNVGDVNSIRRLAMTVHLSDKPLAGVFAALLDGSGNTLIIDNGDSLAVWI